MCDNGKDYGEDEHIPESCPVCGEHKEFSILHRNEIITFDPEGANNYPNISMVEGLLGGVGRLCFPYGTVQFAENETYPDFVYSPRLTEQELEQFCLDNLAKYEVYFDTNFETIDKGDELPPIEQFWL
jgi:hypothetical protein